MSLPLISLAPVHAAVLAGMHRICFAEPWDAAAMQALLTSPGSYGFLASGPAGEMAPVPQGFILARAVAGEAEVLSLLVLPPFRRQGLASRLLAAAFGLARAAAAEEMFLEVAADNAAGQALYAAHGFEEVGRRPRYYAGRIDALVLRKTLERESVGAGSG